MIIAVDIGGTKIAVSRVVDGEVLESREVDTPRPALPDQVIDTVVEEIQQWSSGAGGIGIATAGGVRNGRVTAVSRVILPEWSDVPLAERIAEEMGLPVFVVNDGQAAVWGEHRYGGGRDASDVLFVTVSTGVGGGIVAGGRLSRGAAGRAGHVGHLTVEPEGPWCSCGRRGCLE
jgi:predicted NBD/HSP70 family sugar kinase